MTDGAKRTLTYVEIDIDYCANTYGDSPCTAALGVTGSKRCFNTFKTCQDKANFANQPKTLRYAEGTEYLPGDVSCIPSIKDQGISYTPQKIEPGVSMGERGSVTVTFFDHPHSDTDLDKYVGLREYDPIEQGSYWSKFRARNPYIKGRPFRLIRGTTEQTIDEMEIRHFLIEDTSGPGADGVFKIVAKDPLKVFDGDRAQAPSKSTGTLLAAIDEDDTSFTLDPTGIGDLEYPASGYISIGEEMMTFTRAGDAMTVVRGSNNTTPEQHQSGDLVQVALAIDDLSPDEIISTLALGYTDAESAWIPVDEWAYEVSLYIDRVYSAVIAKPTPVKDLINEIIEQSGLVVWWDDIARQIKLRSLRPIAATADIVTDNQIIAGSLKVTEQPSKRASQVWISFSQINPLEDLTRESNYGSGVLSIDAQSEIDNGMPAIKKVFSRWIAPFARSTATRLGAQVLSRYRDPPRRLAFAVDRFQSDLQLGRGYRLQSLPLQLDTGAPDTVNVMICSLEPLFDKFVVDAEEIVFYTQPELEGTKLIVIDQNSRNVNLRDAYDSIYADLAEDEVVQVIIEAGVIVGSSSNAQWALDTGDWPAGVTLSMAIYGRVQGAGGRGGGPFDAGPERNGGPALRVRRAITIDNATGQIWSGGGGGGGAIESGTSDVYMSGGPGAGYLPGALGPVNVGASLYADGTGPTAGSVYGPFPASTEAGGAFYDGQKYSGGMATWGGYFTLVSGKGGGPGEAGDDGLVSTFYAPGGDPGVVTQLGGSAGHAVDGNSFITWTATGDRRGGIA